MHDGVQIHVRLNTTSSMFSASHQGHIEPPYTARGHVAWCTAKSIQI